MFPRLLPALLLCLPLAACTHQPVAPAPEPPDLKAPLTYIDATGPATVKLRLTSSAPNTTLRIYDAEHCDGQLAGVLGNRRSDSQRRVGMQVATRAVASTYLEVALEPGREYYLMVTFGHPGPPSAYGLTLRAQAGSEFELSLLSRVRGYDVAAKRQDSIGFKTLKMIDGKPQRAQAVMADRGLPACAAQNPLFGDGPPPLADTPERLALVKQAMAAHMTYWHDYLQAPTWRSVDALVSAARASLKLPLPDEYWVLRRTIARMTQDERARAEAMSRAQYQARLEQRLRRLPTADLQRLVDAPEEAPAQALLNSPGSLLVSFATSMQEASAGAIIKQRQRLAALDRRYGVCERSPRCNRYWPDGQLP